MGVTLIVSSKKEKEKKTEENQELEQKEQLKEKNAEQKTVDEGEKQEPQQGVQEENLSEEELQKRIEEGIKKFEEDYKKFTSPDSEDGEKISENEARILAEDYLAIQKDLDKYENLLIQRMQSLKESPVRNVSETVMEKYNQWMQMLEEARRKELRARQKAEEKQKATSHHANVMASSFFKAEISLESAAQDFFNFVKLGFSAGHYYVHYVRLRKSLESRLSILNAIHNELDDLEKKENERAQEIGAKTVGSKYGKEEFNAENDLILKSKNLELIQSENLKSNFLNDKQNNAKTESKKQSKDDEKTSEKGTEKAANDGLKKRKSDVLQKILEKKKSRLQTGGEGLRVARTRSKKLVKN